MNYADIFAMGAPAVNQLPTQPVPGPTTPAAPAPEAGGDPLAAIAVPIQSPAELEQRKAGWAAVYERITGNANMMNALGVIGMNLMQPVRPGDTPVAQTARSVGAGLNAYRAGEFTQYEMQRQARKDAQESEESGARVEASRSATSLNKARLPAVQAESQVAAATVADKIRIARLETERADVLLQSARTDADVKKIEADLKKREADIKKSIPDETIRAGLLAEIEAQRLKVPEAKARIKASNAAAAASSASAANNQLTVDLVKKLAPDEQKEFLTKTGRYSQHTSGIGQQAIMWGNIYDKLPETDPKKKGKTREQFQMDRLSEAKQQDAMKYLTDYIKAVGTDADPDIIASLTEMAKSSLAAKGAGAGTSAGGAVRFVRDANGKIVPAK